MSRLPETACGCLAAAVLAAGVVTAGVRTPVPHDRPLAAPKHPTVQAAAQQWEAQEVSETAGLGGYSFAFAQVFTRWQQGTATTAEVATDASQALALFQTARTQLARMQPLAGAPLALQDYRQAVDLYIASFRLAELTTSVPAGALRTQAELGTTRVRTLADRTYDQADDALAPLAPSEPATSDDAVTVVPPVAVPTWASIGLAPGPPLAAKAAPARPPVAAARTAREPLDFWLAVLRNTGVPTAQDEAAAIDGGDTATQRSVADRLDAAAVKIGFSADPSGAELEATRARLSLLVGEEAVRTAELGSLLPAGQRGQAVALAKALAVTGDQLWSPELGDRSTGFPAAVLTDD